MKPIDGFYAGFIICQMIDTIKFLCRTYLPDCLHSLYSESKYWIMFNFFPRNLANEFHKGIVGYDINWGNPRTLNEKINWLKIYSDTSTWTLLADKYKVREFVKNRVGDNVLVKLFGVWEKSEDIDFEALPNKFVLKTNHGAGTVCVVNDKSKLNTYEICQKLDSWLKLRFGYKTFEPHYLKIKPLIIAEELLENDSSFSSSLVDYKVYCFDGKPYCILVCSDRTIGEGDVTKEFCLEMGSNITLPTK